MKSIIGTMWSAMAAIMLMSCVTEGPGEKCYTVKYDLNATGVTGEAPVDNTRYLSGRTVTVLGTDATRTDWVFTGWNTEADGTGAAYQPGDTFTITSDVILYAQWVSALIWLDVTYDANGGEGELGERVRPGEYIVKTLLETGISRDNYIFTGWNTASDGSGSPYLPGDSENLSENLTLYAQWEPLQVIYHPNGGTGSITDENWEASYTVKSAANLSFARAGHTFTGWNTKADGSGTSYLSGDTVGPITENLHLYAQWEPGPITITYDANQGIGGPFTDPSMSGDPYTVMALAATGITRDGYVFTGWNTDEYGDGDAYTPGDVYNFTEDVTLYAQWRVVMIYYDPNGGIGRLREDAWRDNYQIRTVSNAGFSMEDHKFTGWNTMSNGTGTAYSEADLLGPISEDLLLYAQWEDLGVG